MYKLRRANKSDTQLLIKYKLSTIFEYAEKISEDEKKHINEYVYENVFKLLSEYKIVVVNDKDVGCLLVTNYDDGILLDEIYLEDEYRCCGIGSLLIKELLDEHNVVYLWVYKKNERAIKLYESFNFKKQMETDTRFFMRYEKTK